MGNDTPALAVGATATAAVPAGALLLEVFSIPFRPMLLVLEGSSILGLCWFVVVVNSF